MRRSIRRGRRKCLHCKGLFEPDARTRDRQRHCGAPECKRASKAWRQRRWLAKAENRDYFHGPDQVARVRRWRDAHPGYWRGEGGRARNALQDDCRAQPSGREGDGSGSAPRALQDDSQAQLPLLVGLISSLTGIALQDDIAVLMRRMHARGQRILGAVPGMEPEGRSP